MDAVKAHVAGADNTHDRVEVRTVVIAQAARLVDDLRDLKNVLVKNTDGIRVREHQARGVGADCRAQRVQIDTAVRAGGDVHDLIAAHGSRGRVRAMGRVRNDDLRSGSIAAFGVICLDEQHAGQLAVCARSRLERDRVHAEHFAELAAQHVQRLQRALRRFDRLQRVQLRKARQRRHFLVDLGVILHGAGAERIESVVHTVNALAKRRIVPRQLVLADLRQAQLRRALVCERVLRHVALRQQTHVMSGSALFKNQLHAPSTSFTAAAASSSFCFDTSSVTHHRMPPSTAAPPRMLRSASALRMRSHCSGVALVANSWKNSPPCSLGHPAFSSSEAK